MKPFQKEKKALTCVVLIRGARPSSPVPLLSSSQFPVSGACDIVLPHCTFDSLSNRSEACDKISLWFASHEANPVSTKMLVVPQLALGVPGAQVERR